MAKAAMRVATLMAVGVAAQQDATVLLQSTISTDESQEGRLGLQEGNDAPVQLMQDDFLWHMLVSPEHKMMACKNYKAGSSELSHLFSTLWHDPDRVALHRDKNWTRSAAGCQWFTQKWAEYPVDFAANCNGMPSEAITLHQFKPIEVNATKMVNGPDWYKVMVARDPLDRFISGILEKCGIHLQVSNACPAKEEVKAYLSEVGGEDAWPALSNTSAEAKMVRQGVMNVVIEKLEQIAFTQRQNGKHWGFANVDPHFKPPSSMCGAGNGLEFDHVILYDPRDFSDKVEALLEKVAAKDAHELRKDFDVLGNNDQSTSGAYGTAADRIKDMLTQSLATRLVWLYAEDYHKFPTMRDRIPGWLDQASLPNWDNFQASMKAHVESLSSAKLLKKAAELLSPPPAKVDMSAEED